MCARDLLKIVREATIALESKTGWAAYSKTDLTTDTLKCARDLLIIIQKATIALNKTELTMTKKSKRKSTLEHALKELEIVHNKIEEYEKQIKEFENQIEECANKIIECRKLLLPLKSKDRKECFLNLIDAQLDLFKDMK